MSDQNDAATATPNTVPEVIARLETIQTQAAAADGLGPSDGLACFNYLYTAITKDILGKLSQKGWFSDDQFLASLDVQFARRYFNALAAYATSPDLAPRSWRVLLDRRADDGIAPIQFAAAGVNAHVNYDLACALVATCEALGSELGAAKQHDDYQRINQIFAEQMAGLRHHFEDQLDRRLDESAIKTINDAIDDAMVILTRDAAWNHAEHLWSIRSNEIRVREQTEGIDLLVSLAGRGLLARF